LLPDTIKRFQDTFAEEHYSQGLFPVKDMKEAVEKAYELTAKSRSCLLSPAAASYNSYKNFEERGEDYKKLIAMLQ
jgi:UDP-N-acetylmuramoylalanine--D-glutamate ligase